MVIGIKSITVGTATPGQPSVTTSESPSATAVGDIVVVFHGNNFYAATNMVAPAATGTPTMNAITGGSADGGTNLAHIKSYWYQVNTAGAQVISETETGTHDEEKYLIAVVLSGVDTSNPIDVAAGSSGASSTSFVAPAVSPATADAFLLAVASDGGGLQGGPFTTPATYTEDADFSIGASNMSGVAAHKQLAASGSTGTITFTATTAQPWAAVTVAVRTGGAAGPPAQPWIKFSPGAALKRKLLVRQTGLLKEAAKVVAPPVTWFTSLSDGTTPVLLVSAEDWGILANGGLNHAGDFAATYDDYFSHRQAQGYNCILVSLFSFTSMSGARNGPDSDGTYPFNTNSTDPANPANSTFWARRDAFLSTAASYGFRVMLNASTPLVHSGSFTAPWTNTQWGQLGTFLGNRYAAQSNILWMLGDDYFDDIDPGFDAFYNALRAAGATQPITIQNWQETSSRFDIYNGGTRPWGFAHAQYNFGYSYNVSYDVVEKMGNEANPIPYFWGDGTFLNTGGITSITDVQLMRRLVWWALSSGSKGFQVGDNDMWPWDATALGFVTSKTFYTTVIPAITTYFRGLPNWHLLKADTSSQLVTAGRGTHASPLVSGGGGGQYLSNADSYVTASFIQSGTHAGELAVIYMSHASTITIDETKMVAGYTATWVDPKSGATSAATPGTTYNSGSKGTNSDGEVDWVLVLAAPSSGANLSRSQSETVTISDTVVAGVTLARSQSESVTAADTQARALAEARSQSESVTVGDSLARAATRTRAQAESVTVGDSTSRALADGRAQAESVTIGDANARALALARGQSESVTVGDVTSGSTGGNASRSLSESVTVADAAVRGLQLPRAQAESVTAADSVARSTTRSRAQSESVTVSDATARAVGRFRTASESVTVSDTTARHPSLGRAFNEPITITDLATAGTVQARQLLESLTITDTTVGSTHGQALDLSLVGFLDPPTHRGILDPAGYAGRLAAPTYTGRIP